MANAHTVAGERIYGLLDHEALDSEHVVTSLTSGLGYSSLDVRYYDAAEIATASYPAETRRAFLTTFGWPNAAFATNARNVGLRFAAELGPNSPSDDAALHDGRPTVVRVLWAGFCLDALLFGTLFLMPWVLFRRKATCCYLPRYLVAATCFGLWFALLIAWSSDLAYHAVPSVPQNYKVLDDPIAFDSSVGPLDIRHQRHGMRSMAPSVIQSDIARGDTTSRRRCRTIAQ